MWGVTVNGRSGGVIGSTVGVRYPNTYSRHGVSWNTAERVSSPHMDHFCDHYGFDNIVIDRWWAHYTVSLRRSVGRTSIDRCEEEG